MTETRILKPANRLSKILQSGNGPSSADLIAAAVARVDQMGPELRAFVALKTKEIVGYAARDDDALFAECRPLGEAATHVAEVAGAAGQDAIGEVARGISVMIEGLFRDGVWHTEALRLHLAALALINPNARASETQNALILDRLHQMRQAVGVVE
jgi:hypothetical protein